MKNYKYLPIIRTRDAELKGFNELSTKVKGGVLPLFELTKGRRTKKDPIGDIEKKSDRLLEILNGAQFILDLTTDPRFSNRQIDGMLHDSSDGFKLWRKFIEKFNPIQCIPIIHFNPNVPEEIKKQVNELKLNHPYLAFRINSDNPKFTEFVNQILSLVGDPEKLILIIDSGYVRLTEIGDQQDKLSNLLGGLTSFKNKLCAISGFPASVTTVGYGRDEYGKFDLAEVLINQHLNKTKLLSAYCDYALIHPIPLDGFGGWVPRIDFPLNSNCYYYRYRQDDGGYELAAVKVLKDKDFEDFPETNWGIEQIRLAASGEPEGRSPSHWIAVRVNIHITRQFYRVKGQPGIHL